MKKYLTILTISFGMCLLFMSMIPLPKATVENVTVVEGIVADVKLGEGESDVIIEMLGDPNLYYINRGLENGILLKTLKAAIQYKEIKLQYITRWGLLNPTMSSRHVAKIECEGKTLYSEMDC